MLIQQSAKMFQLTRHETATDASRLRSWRTDAPESTSPAIQGTAPSGTGAMKPRRIPEVTLIPSGSETTPMANASAQATAPKAPATQARRTALRSTASRSRGAAHRLASIRRTAITAGRVRKKAENPVAKVVPAK